MNDIIIKSAFYEFGKSAPTKSGFKGTMSHESLFGQFANYTARDSATKKSVVKEQDKDLPSLMNYTDRDNATKNSAKDGKYFTMTNEGKLYTEEDRKKWLENSKEAFSQPNSIAWQLVVSLQNYDLLEEYQITDQNEMSTIAKLALYRTFNKLHLDPNNFVWWEDYHTNTKHPHMHITFTEKDPTRTKGKFNKKELNMLKTAFMTELVQRKQSYEKFVSGMKDITPKLTEQIKLNERRIIPIRIEPIDLKGLFSPIVYIDIVDKTEQEAALEILNGISETHPRIAINKFPSYYNVEHLQIDNDYYVSQTDIIFIKTCKCKILKDGFNKIHNRITWFADEKIELILLTKNVEIEILNLRDTNLNYNVVFNHTFKRDEIVEYRIKAVLSNENKHFNNFFSSEIITPIKDLNIHLNLIDLNVDKIYTQKISSSPLNARTEKPNEIDFFSPYHWHIPNPEIHFEYKIYW